MIVNDSAKYRLLLVVTICKRIGLNRLLRDTSFHNIGLRLVIHVIMNAAFTNKKVFSLMNIAFWYHCIPNL